MLSVCLQSQSDISCHSALLYKLTSSPVPKASQFQLSSHLRAAVQGLLVVLFCDWPKNRRPDGYRITDRAASCCPVRFPGEEVRHLIQMFGPFVSTNSYCTRASYDSEFKSIYLVAGLLFGRRYLACNLYYPAVSNLSSRPRRSAPSFVPIPINNILCSSN